MKTAVSVPDAVFRSAERMAKRLGISRSELYSTAVREFIDRRDGAALTAKLNAACAELDTSMDPAVLRAQARAIGPEEW